MGDNFSRPTVLKTMVIEPPYPWATDQRARVHSLTQLKGIRVVSGKAKCSDHGHFTVSYNVKEKFREITEFIRNGKEGWNGWAPQPWTIPKPPVCNRKHCRGYCTVIISEKKRAIDWLFLVLGQHVGLCSPAQLRYFCKHNHLPYNGSRLEGLYKVYLTLCKQLHPQETLFDIDPIFLASPSSSSESKT